MTFLPISQRRHHQPLLGAQVLELVVEIDVGDGNHAGAVVIDVVRSIRSPVEACLVKEDASCGGKS